MSGISRQPWDKHAMARRIAAELEPGSYVNIGIGLPTSLIEVVDPDSGIVFHSENGIVGYRTLGEAETPDAHAIDAGSRLVGLVPGAAVVAHDVSFAIARGGHLDATVLGAFQVSEHGDLANWAKPGGGISGIGGAMDLAMGAKRLYVMMRHTERDGSFKIVRECSYPRTASGRVTAIVTEFCFLRVTDTGLLVEQLAPGVTRDFLQEITEPTLAFMPGVGE